MSSFTQYKLKDGRRIRGRYDSKSTRVCISRSDLEGLIYEADVAYEQAEQLQTIIENLIEIKQQAITKVLDEIRTEIKEWYWQAGKQSLVKDPCVVDAMIDLFIRTIDKYKAEGEE